MQPLSAIRLIVAVATVALVGIAAIGVATTAVSLLVQSASATTTTTTTNVITTTTPTTNVTTHGALASSGSNNNNNNINSNVTLGNLFAVAQGIDETYSQINDTYAEASYVQSVTLMPPNATTTINATETGNYTVNILPNGLTPHVGQAFLVTQEDGDGRGEEENATLTFVSLGYVNPNGTGSRTGVEFFSTNSTGQLAFLDNMVAIYHIESSPERTTIRTWEWKGGGIFPFQN